MSDFHEGDLVEAVKGETVIRARLANSKLSDSRHITVLPNIPAEQTTYLEVLEAEGWTVTVIERAKPALPTAMYSIVRFPNKIPAMRFEDMLWYHIGYVGLFRGDDKQAGKTDAQLLADCGSVFEVAEFGVTEAQS